MRPNAARGPPRRRRTAKSTRGSAGRGMFRHYSRLGRTAVSAVHSTQSARAARGMRRRAAFEPLEGRTMLHDAGYHVAINFQPAPSAIPDGYFADTGATFGDRGNGMSFGWNADNSANTRDKNLTSDQRYDTLAHMQKGGTFTWEIAVPNGDYAV